MTGAAVNSQRTAHDLIIGDARSMDVIADHSIDLVVTSPPYPMIELWDPLFISQDSRIEHLLHNGRGTEAFRYMHMLLDPVWRDLCRVIKPGGFVCINIGDATRRVGDDFRLYPNHSLVQQRFLELGFDALPLILWWKPTNSPTKFMGSGMLAAGAYVTLEHEYILIFRKGKKRVFATPEAKLLRRKSALFWEERNRWYADRWDLSGVRQEIAGGAAGSGRTTHADESGFGSGAAKQDPEGGAALDRRGSGAAKHNPEGGAALDRRGSGADENRQTRGTTGSRPGASENSRTRNAAFPLELAYRLINMYSVQGDTVLDPFAGTGTTLLAGLAACRSSLGVEIDPSLCAMFTGRAARIIPGLNTLITERLRAHTQFVSEREQAKKPLRYTNRHYGFPVMSGQETELFFPPLKQVTLSADGNMRAVYSTDTRLENIPSPVRDMVFI
jgi:DNA modification methylase